MKKKKSNPKKSICKTNCNVDGFLGIMEDMKTLGLEMLSDSLKSKKKWQAFTNEFEDQYAFIHYLAEAVQFFTEEKNQKRGAKK